VLTESFVAKSLDAHGYAVVRGFLSAAEVAGLAAACDRLEAEAMRHGRSFRHGNLFFQVDPAADGRPARLRMVQWPAWICPTLDAVRRHPAYGRLLAPLLGQDIRQVIHQIHWKARGVGSGGDYAWHQDCRSRRPANAFRNLGTSYIQTGIAIDPHGPDSGGLRVIPGSHRRGDLKLRTDEVVLGRATSDADLQATGIDPAEQVALELAPGDLALWSPYLLHASGANASDHYRRFLINGYARGADCDRGEWTFRAGASVPLPPTPSLTHYEALFERPEPHYP
jgi:ectoine hydroxylase-related dioxygenase (phytanoyl-CoA dioxygenase family)